MKAMNFKMDEKEIAEMKSIANIFHMSVTDYIKNAIADYSAKLKQDPFYRLTINARNADPEETEEVLNSIDSLSDDDLEIVSTKHFSI
ncbi:MAG: hypothetical protein LIV24_00630 [Eubacterium sp.]|nr:hypothetical protein [Eubacterium sp.]